MEKVINECNILVYPGEDYKATLKDREHINYYLSGIQAAIFLLDTMENDAEFSEAICCANVQQYSALMEGLKELAQTSDKLSKWEAGQFLGKYHISLYELI